MALRSRGSHHDAARTGPTARAADVVAGADALAGGLAFVVEMARDVHRAVARRAFHATGLVVGPAVAPVRVAHDTVSEAVYAVVRSSLRTAVRGGGRLVAEVRPLDAPAHAGRASVGVARAVVNGLWGDRLADGGSALDLGIGLRHAGADVPLTRGSLAAAYPDATDRIVLFVHGLTETEASWRRPPPASGARRRSVHGEGLRRDLGFTPVWLRHNSGRRVSETGRDLDGLIELVHERWPVPVTEIALVGHSMGGLVARSAVATAAARQASWVDHATHVVCLGSPHHGAPLEKLVNATAWALGSVPEARPFATFLNARSVGIKDLRYGNVGDQDWADSDPDALLRDTRVDAPFVHGVTYHAVGARIGPAPLGRIVGDSLVRLSSATGRSRVRTLPFDRTVEVGPHMHHMALLDHPAVYDHVRDALASRRRAPTEATHGR